MTLFKDTIAWLYFIEYSQIDYLHLLTVIIIICKVFRHILKSIILLSIMQLDQRGEDKVTRAINSNKANDIQGYKKIYIKPKYLSPIWVTKC